MSKDYRDMLCELRNAGAEFLVVGAHALGAHGIIRGTLDFDIWVRPTSANAQCVWCALGEFGAPMHNIVAGDFETSGLILQIGVTPNRIDLMTTISGVAFENAWQNRIEVAVFDQTVPVIGRQ